jgi:thiol-disulfide isomerase/thioredoxin
MKYAFVLIAFALGFSSSVSAQQVIPNVNVVDVNGQSIALADYMKNGKPKIVSLWATWCGPCRMELNALKAVYPKWKKNYGIEIIAISVDVPAMAGRAKKMFETNAWNYTFMHDNKQELLSALGIQSIPYSMLIDGNGNIKSVQVGYHAGYEKEMEDRIKNL